MRMAPVPVALDTQLCSGMVVQDGDTSDLPRGRFALDGPHLEVGPLPQGAVVTLMLEPGAVYGLGGHSKDTIEWRVNVRKPSDYGVIRVLKDTSMTTDTTHVWMLLNASGLPLREARMDEDGSFRGCCQGVMAWRGSPTSMAMADGMEPDPLRAWPQNLCISGRKAWMSGPVGRWKSPQRLIHGRDLKTCSLGDRNTCQTR